MHSINGIKLKNDCHLFYYNSSTDRAQSSGAYIFRPENDEPVALGAPKLFFNNGDISFDIMVNYPQKTPFFRMVHTSVQNFTP